MTIAHARSSRSQTIASWSGKKVLVTLALIAGTLSSSSLYARELNSSNIASYCSIIAQNCLMQGIGITSIASGTFAGYSTLQTLTLENNQIASIESGDFDGLDNIQDLNLQRNQIISIELGSFTGLDNLQSLDLGINQIISIESGDFAGLPNLQSLNLGSNQITSIESGDFDGLDNLQTLILEANQITSIESGDFTELDNLQVLDLGSNLITSIESGDFAGLTNLQTLNLEINQITSIESGDFTGLSNLQTLSFAYGQLTSIDVGSFNGLSSLQYLRLRANQITSIESGDFAGLNNLQSLDLFYNQITSIEVGDFAGLTNLQTLDLQSNQITSIEVGDLTGLDNFQNLDLGWNQITSIESGDFAGLTNLQRLGLQNNQIKSVKVGSFSGLNTLDSLSLRGNQIKSIESGLFDGLSSLQSLTLDYNCLNTEDTSVVSYLNGLSFIQPYTNQYVCVGVGYSPMTPTSGSVTGSLVLYGPTSKVVALQSDNTNMSIYDHIFTANGSYLFDYNSIVDSNNYLWANSFGGSKTITGTVTWIDNVAPGAPTIIAPISGTSMLADITSGVSVIWSGTAETGSLVTVSISGQTYTGITDSNGNFNIPTVLMLPVGSYTARVTATDSVGNTSPESTVTIDFTAIVTPSTPTNNGGAGGGGAVSLRKDECPQGDFTASYYDNACGSQAGTGKQHNVAGSENNTTKKPLTTTQPAAVDTLTYLDSEIYNDTIANDYCYTRQSDIFITRNKTGIFTPEEFNKALTFLYAYELTRYNNIDQFQPYDVLSREQAAKIFSNFAIHVLCRKPNTALHKNYNDIHSANDNLQSYITLSYQLGLMKGDPDGKFRPKDTITKAEVNAILVRLLLENYLPEDTGDTRYSHYNTVSKKLNIITQDTDDNSITRQDTSLMLFRAYKNQIFELQGGSYSLKNRESFLSL